MKYLAKALALVMMAVVGVAIAAACGGGPKAPEVTLGAADYSFTFPDSLAGGLVGVRFTNNGKEDHHAQFLRLNDGVTQQQFQATFQGALQAAATEGEAALFRIFEVATLDGGPPTIAPGKAVEVVMALPQGQYVIVCFVPGADGIPHIAKGMIKPLTVTAAPAEQPSPPSVAGTVDLVDFAFATFPTEIKVGKTEVGVTNKGKEPHEMTVVRLKGISVTQLLEILGGPPPTSGATPPGPPPFEFAGGFQAMMPGQTGWTILDLTAGDYAAICFIPSPANAFKPHFALGMARAFTVK